MIEQVMIFALGACVAGLLALLCLPAIARRALRMAQVAVERQMPISVEEIVAQRDLLRAEFATDRRRLEQTLEEAQAAQARDMGEAGRRTIEISRLGADLAATTAARDAALAAAALASRQMNETAAENIALQKQLYDADGDAARQHRLFEALTDAHRSLTQADIKKSATIERLSGDLADSKARSDIFAQELSQTRLDLSVASARGEALLAQIDNHEETIRSGQANEADLRRRIEEAARDAVEASNTAKDAAVSPVDEEDMAMLRRTIVEIGREVVRLSGEHQALAPREHEAVRTPASVN